MAMIGDSRIVDAKTIMLLQYAALNIFRQDLVMPGHSILPCADCVNLSAMPGIHVFFHRKP
jgi:hypothetical protein